MAMPVVERESFVPPVGTELSLARWAQKLERSIIRKMVAVVSQPDIVSFAGGLPAPELFPRQAYAAALARVIGEEARSMQYGPPFRPLKKHIVELMAKRGVDCDEEQVFITTGAQQALSVLSALLLDPGGEVLLEQVVYTGIQQAVAPRMPNLVSVSTDLETGMDVAAVRSILEAGHRPAFIYAIPDAHNPLGVSLSARKRAELVALAEQFCVPIVEDDPYGFLRFDDQTLPPLRSLSDDLVFYVGSFSKIIAPALRLGWLVAPERLVPKLTVIKEALDLETSALTQQAVSAYLDDGDLAAHIALLRDAYRRRRDAMLETLAATLPAQADWTVPVGGMFIWVELPGHIDTVSLLEQSLATERVAFIPGRAFAVPGHNANHCLRLSFANVPVERIVEGISRLASVVNDFL